MTVSQSYDRSDIFSDPNKTLLNLNTRPWVRDDVGGGVEIEPAANFQPSVRFTSSAHRKSIKPSRSWFLNFLAATLPQVVFLAIKMPKTVHFYLKIQKISLSPLPRRQP